MKIILIIVMALNLISFVVQLSCKNWIVAIFNAFVSLVLLLELIFL